MNDYYTELIQEVKEMSGINEAMALHDIVQKCHENIAYACKIGFDFQGSIDSNGMHSLWGCFVFSETDQGHEYWADVTYALKINFK